MCPWPRRGFRYRRPTLRLSLNGIQCWGVLGVPWYRRAGDGGRGRGVGGRIVGHGAHTCPTYCRQFERLLPTATGAVVRSLGAPCMSDWGL